MIVDMILDRKDGTPYNAKAFYNYCMEEWSIFKYYIGEEITRAMDAGDNERTQAALCKYIEEQGYNPEICSYINGKNWIEDDKLNPMCEGCKCRDRADTQGRICRGTTEQVWSDYIIWTGVFLPPFFLFSGMVSNVEKPSVIIIGRAQAHK